MEEVISKLCCCCCHPKEEYTENFQSYLVNTHTQEIPKDFFKREVLYEVGNLKPAQSNSPIMLLLVLLLCPFWGPLLGSQFPHL